MTAREQIAAKKHEEDLERLRGFRLLDDDFLTKCFEGDPKSSGARQSRARRAEAELPHPK